jgi:hypothetical protein
VTFAGLLSVVSMFGKAASDYFYGRWACLFFGSRVLCTIARMTSAENSPALQRRG